MFFDLHSLRQIPKPQKKNFLFLFESSKETNKPKRLCFNFFLKIFLGVYVMLVFLLKFQNDDPTIKMCYEVWKCEERSYWNRKVTFLSSKIHHSKSFIQNLSPKSNMRNLTSELQHTNDILNLDYNSETFRGEIHTEVVLFI